jgi:hypothetical protein
MELVERYLAAVANHLPVKNRDDVVAELRDMLLSKVEEREQRLGRRLDKADIEAMLREVGHPTLVAARYWRMQHLIGPQIFPFYVATLKIVGVIVLIIHAILFGIGVLSSGDFPGATQGAVGALLGALMQAFGWVTLVFAGLEQFGLGKTLGCKWKANELPPVTKKRRRSAFDLWFEVVSGVVFILWWMGVIRFGDFIPNGGADHFQMQLAPFWDTIYWPVLLYVGATTALRLMEALRPGWVRASAAANAVLAGVGVGLAVAIFRADRLILVTGPDAAETARLSGIFELGLDIAMAITVATCLVQLIMHVRRFIDPAVETRSCVSLP